MLMCVRLGSVVLGSCILTDVLETKNQRQIGQICYYTEATEEISVDGGVGSA
jgi:hypothetical protein